MSSSSLLICLLVLASTLLLLTNTASSNPINDSEFLGYGFSDADSGADDDQFLVDTILNVFRPHRHHPAKSSAAPVEEEEDPEIDGDDDEFMPPIFEDMSELAPSEMTAEHQIGIRRLIQALKEWTVTKPNKNAADSKDEDAEFLASLGQFIKWRYNPEAVSQEGRPILPKDLKKYWRFGRG